MNDSRCINAEELGNSTGFMDYSKQEWHWLFLSGADKTPKEMVYDVKRNKWYEISRGEDANIQCGLSIEDTEGNQYIYGFIDSGYIERLEYGTDFDGNEITSTFQTGDFAPLGLSYVTQLDRLKLMTVIPSSQVLSEITCTAYTDTSIAGEGYSMIPSKNGSYRIATPSFDGKLQGDPYHSLKFTTTTTTETCGFKPLAVVATFHPLTED